MIRVGQQKGTSLTTKRKTKTKEKERRFPDGQEWTLIMLR